MIRITFGPNNRNTDIPIVDRDSHRISMFLSVLMASLFVTNSGDVISELVGGVLQQSSISLVLKILCAIVFLYALPSTLRRLTKVKLIIAVTSILVVMFNLLLFSNEQFIDTIITYFTMCFTGFFAAEGLKDFSLLKQYLIKTSRIVAVTATIMLILSFSGIISSLRTGGYRMGLGYACITCVMFLLWSFVEKRKLIDLIGVFALLALIFLYGSRGPIVGVALFVVYFGLRYLYKRKQYILCVLLFLVLVVGVVFFNDIMGLMDIILEKMGVSSRTIYLFANQNLAYDAGRNDIWDAIVAEIQKNPFVIRGINAEYEIVGTYAHNIIIEMIYQHGVIIGGIALFYILAKVIETLLLNVKDDGSGICLIFMFACIPSLMFSGSVWIAQNFWIWLALIIGFSRERRYAKESHNY
jgi:hypothetical protein